MSSGTLVKIERYYNRYHLHDLDEARTQRDEAIKQRDEVWGSILALCMATPRDITPKDEEPMDYVSRLVDTLREQMDYVDCHLQALDDIIEGWDTKEED